MDQTSMQRLRGNVRIFEQMAEGMKQRAANLTDAHLRRELFERLTEIQQHVSQLKGQLVEVERHKNWRYAHE
jgi:hypothetical protein